MYSAVDKRTWGPDDSRQRPPGRLTKKTTAGNVNPGDAVYDAFFMAWRGVLCITPCDNPKYLEVCFEDGGMAVVSGSHIFYVNKDGTRGWSEPEQARLFYEDTTVFDAAMNALLIEIQTPEQAACYKRGKKYVTVSLHSMLERPQFICRVSMADGAILTRRGKPVGSIYEPKTWTPWLGKRFGRRVPERRY